MRKPYLSGYLLSGGIKMAFHHPYNFIPVTGKLNGQTISKPKYDQVKEGRTAARHDLWLKDCYSGRVVCRLHLDTPTVVGAKQEEDDHPSKLVTPYRRNDQLAIPGNSLRGMIGSIAETLSQSSLRVLEDRLYSIREPVGKGDRPSGSCWNRLNPTAVLTFYH
jgi:hypothetical protein